MQDIIEIHKVRLGLLVKIFFAEILSKNDQRLVLRRNKDIIEIDFKNGSPSANFTSEVTVGVHYGSEDPSRSLRPSAKAYRINEKFGPVVKKYSAYFWDTKKGVYILFVL